MLLLKNCKIFKEDNFETLDVLIEHDTIVKIGKIDESQNYKVIDVDNKYLLPGFIDFHVHLEDRINGFDIADTYESGTRNALKNGITTIFSFITQQLDESLQEAVARTHKKANNKIWTDVGWHVTPTKFENSDFGAMKELIQDGTCSFKLYTTYKEAGIYSTYPDIENFVNKLGSENILTMVHCEDNELIETKEYSINSQELKSLPKIRTKMVEISAIKKIMRIAKRTNSYFHIAHVSSAEGVEIINKLKYKGLVSCESCPQYLYLDNSMYKTEDKSQYLCYPPLRDTTNINLMKEGLRFGDITIMASDHCPFTIDDKNKYTNSYKKIPGGLLGLDFLPYLTSNLFLRESDKVKFLYYKLCEGPARLAGLFPEKGAIMEGSIADLVILDFDDTHKLESRDNIFNPYKNVTTDLNIRKVIQRGKVMVENKRILSDKPGGGMM